MATEKTFPSDAADKYVVRFPDGMRDQIAEAAKAAGRSMNAEIVLRLQQSFGSAKVASPPPSELWNRVSELERLRSGCQGRLTRTQMQIEHVSMRLLQALEEKEPQEEVQRLRRERANYNSDRYDIEHQLAAIAHELAELYAQASTDAPGASGRTREVRMERLD